MYYNLTHYDVSEIATDPVFRFASWKTNVSTPELFNLRRNTDLSHISGYNIFQ
jgi:hypothetical protein